MQKKVMFAAITLSTNSIAFGQNVVSVDFLNPSETTGTIPSNFRIVDIRVDVATTDTWVAGNIRAIAEHGARFNYQDSDSNTPGMQPILMNPGFEHRFLTSLSKPRGRNASARFTNGAVAIAGSFDPPAPFPVNTPVELNVSYFALPPETADSPSVDGFVARVSIDINGVDLPPGGEDFNLWDAGPIDLMPPGAFVVLRSVPVNDAFGTSMSTFDIQQPNGLSWAMWMVVPEPSSLALLVLGAQFIVRRRLDRRVER